MPKSQFSDAYEILLVVLVKARREAGITQAELSKRLNKPQPVISNMERGVRRIDLIEFCAIARALGRTPGDLFAEIEARLPKRLEI